MSAYSVSSGTSVMTGRRGCMDASMSSHIPSDSDMCVSASMTPGMEPPFVARAWPARALVRASGFVIS